MNTTHSPKVNLIRGDCVLEGCKAAALSARVAELEVALRDMAAQCATVARLESCGEKGFLVGLSDVMLRTVAKGTP